MWSMLLNMMNIHQEPSSLHLNVDCLDFEVLHTLCIWTPILKNRSAVNLHSNWIATLDCRQLPGWFTLQLLNLQFMDLHQLVSSWSSEVESFASGHVGSFLNMTTSHFRLSNCRATSIKIWLCQLDLMIKDDMTSCNQGLGAYSRFQHQCQCLLVTCTGKAPILRLTEFSQKPLSQYLKHSIWAVKLWVCSQTCLSYVYIGFSSFTDPTRHEFGTAVEFIVQDDVGIYS